MYYRFVEWTIYLGDLIEIFFVLKELVMDILRVLATPDLEVRKKTLSLILDLVSSRNIEDIVLVLKKVQIQKIIFI